MNWRAGKRPDSPPGSVRPAAESSKLRILPRRVKRFLPVYIVSAFVLLVFLNADLLSLVPPSIALDRQEVLPRKGLPGSTFPQKIWQIWRVDPLAFEQTEFETANTWLEQNPSMRYEVITDRSDVAFVEQHYGPGGFNRPDIVEFYHNVTIPIVKADLLRYMVLYAEGGIYADIDVEALKPFHRFIPDSHDEREYDVVVGIEVDEPRFRDHPILGQKSQSFCQWTIVSRPQHSVMMRLIENIMKWLKRIASQQKVPVSDVDLNFDEVITGTGPSAFTTALLEEMNKNERAPKVTWDMFHNMAESKVVNRVLVLTVEAFCAGQGHSDSGNHEARSALVKHHYHASNWPNRHPRYSHPVYGPVEVCNWDEDCVRQWDQDVADYEKLPDEEKKAWEEGRS
ncbi:glycosyl transferase [Aspergillus sp. HF37]|nr:glycosyl transferase [Aspergillus sp. HF37]